MNVAESFTNSTPAKFLPFSIDNLLKPDTPKTPEKPDVKITLPVTPISAQKQTVNTSPKTSTKKAVKPEIEVPVDLSKTSNEAPKVDPDCPPGMVRGGQSGSTLGASLLVLERSTGTSISGLTAFFVDVLGDVFTVCF
eukprot:TRINITY_DN39187_c0_g1_i1.p2 TRINITY_DN39187_c0_g1~~TRINITY_DN39187_c0_g1_i1.p2  ORF type:complete len:138 (-),score=21.32 TRINITY_DN39187_c0_g1_i1:145-558(-)